MIKVFASKVFKLEIPDAVNIFSISQGISQINEDSINEIREGSPNEENSKRDIVVQLAKLCFMVGHVAVKEIVHLEAIESEWKRRKYLGSCYLFNSNLEKKEAKKSSDDLDQVNGTAEDEFAEKIIHLRERELLYGDKALLAIFGPMISFICLHNRSFNVLEFCS